MSDKQSTLGEDDGIAEELAASQRSISVAEFFEKNKHMLGFDSNARSIITAIKEGVDNALDATEEAEILPDILVEVSEEGDYYGLVLEDNGPGIPVDNIPKVFGKLLYGSRFGSMTQSRGQQGIGISAAVLYSQLTSGKPIKITSRPKGGDAHVVELTLDTDTNEAVIHSSEQIEWDRPHGTRIEMQMEANMRARSRLYDYIRATAVVNPHARITFNEPDLEDALVFERGTDDLPQKPEEIRPHPHGVELGHVIKMLASTDSNTLSGFLQEEFTRVGKTTANNILTSFRDDWYGREMAWDISQYGAGEDEDEMPSLTDVIIEAVSNKSPESKDEFSSDIVEMMEDEGRVGYCDIARIVHEVSEDVEDGFAITYGSTVRENVIDALWESIRTVCPRDMRAIVSDATTDRKKDSAVENVANVVCKRLSKSEKRRATHSEIEQFVEAGAEIAADVHDAKFGNTSQEKIVDAIWERMHTVDDKVPLVREAAEDRDIVSSLIYGMKETKVSRPSTKCLSPITADKVEAGLRKEYDAEFFSATQRDAGVHSGHPFIVEAGLAYGGEIEAEGKIDMLRFANRVPLVYQPGACGITQTVGGINWRNYKLSQPGGSGLPEGEVVLMIHVGSTNVPFTSESKDALASVPDIEYEIEQAVREVSRDLKSHLKKKESLKERQNKQNEIAVILPTMAQKLAQTTDDDTPAHEGSLAKVMNNMFVSRETDGDQVTVSLRNHTGGQKTVTVTGFVDSKPASDDDDVEVVDMDDGEWAVKWRGPVRKNGSASFTYTVDAESSHEFAFEDIEEEKVTIAA